MSYGTFVHSPDEMPSCEHWAIIEGSSVTIPGDERSRTNPGHGYPEHTDKYITYEYFTDKGIFEGELKKRVDAKYSYRSIRGIHVLGVYRTRTEVELQEPA